ncbi:hypothetical protein LPJ73_004598, partial [Coemansia sp. RSA 2703]
MRRTREMWPHQIHRSLAMHKLPHRTLEIPEWYSLQVVDRLGTQPADFDSVNAAITRVAVMRQAEGPSPLGSSAQTGDTSATDACFWSPGAREPPGVEHVASPAFNEARGQWAAEQPPASAAPQPMPTETNPDVLRANFIEVCRDQNSLEMLWQQTIGRYRNAWRAHCAGTVPDGESPKSKPMVVDMFSEGMWQARRSTSNSIPIVAQYEFLADPVVHRFGTHNSETNTVRFSKRSFNQQLDLASMIDDGTFHVQLRAFNTTYSLVVEPNHDLIHPDAVLTQTLETGQVVKTPIPTHDIGVYRGHVLRVGAVQPQQMSESLRKWEMSKRDQFSFDEKSTWVRLSVFLDAQGRAVLDGMFGVD